jgi:hypothetical protein
VQDISCMRQQHRQLLTVYGTCELMVGRCIAAAPQQTAAPTVATHLQCVPLPYSDGGLELAGHQDDGSGHTVRGALPHPHVEVIPHHAAAVLGICPSCHGQAGKHSQRPHLHPHCINVGSIRSE